jgi:Asp-tRNA(Asn)/Glu-tRNA(Gln) amidotransferase A subunit family amidase
MSATALPNARTGATEDAARMTAAEARAAIASGALGREDIVAAQLERITRLEPEVRAFSWIDPALALRRAREADKQRTGRVLDGLTLAVKDMIDTADMPTQHNSPLYVDHQPAKDAIVVGAARAEGALILGKVDTHEFAAGGRLPAARNPHDTAHTPGGSSSDRAPRSARASRTSRSARRPADRSCAPPPSAGSSG